MRLVFFTDPTDIIAVRQLRRQWPFSIKESAQAILLEEGEELNWDDNIFIHPADLFMMEDINETI